MKIKELNDLIEKQKSTMFERRRHFHKFPELSYVEHETASFIFRTLEALGKLELSKPTPTSVMARLVGSEPGKVLVIRADIDALPLQEENDFSFVSQNPGVMHACGHDGHIAMLLSVAEILSDIKEEIRGEVRFIFQHAEEKHPPGGAEQLVQAGVMENVDFVIGAHLWVPLQVGKIGIVYGPMMAAPDIFKITIKGRGGHAAAPHQTIDSIAIGAQVIINLQHIVARNTDPLDNAVVSVTQFMGGTKDNIIPGTAEICGTVRTFDAKLRQEIPQLMERIVKGITEAHGATYNLSYHFGYRPVVSSEGVTRVIADTVQEVLGEEALTLVKPSMGGEDFSAYLQEAPGAFFFVGAGNQAKGLSNPHHHSSFNFDEEALVYGVKVFVYAALKLLV